MRKIYVINGFPGSGKTKFGEMVAQELKPLQISFLHSSSIAPIKHLLMPKRIWDYRIIPKKYWKSIEVIKRENVGADWDGETKNEFWRLKMSQFKLALIVRYPDLLNDYVLSQHARLREPSIQFVDIREPENIVFFSNYCRRRYSQIALASIFIQSNRAQTFNNPSDARVLQFQYDYTFINNFDEADNKKSLTELKRNVKWFVANVLCRGIIKY